MKSGSQIVFFIRQLRCPLSLSSTTPLASPHCGSFRSILHLLAGDPLPLVLPMQKKLWLEHNAVPTCYVQFEAITSLFSTKKDEHIHTLLAVWCRVQIGQGFNHVRPFSPRTKFEFNFVWNLQKKLLTWVLWSCLERSLQHRSYTYSRKTVTVLLARKTGGTVYAVAFVISVSILVYSTHGKSGIPNKDPTVLYIWATRW